MGNEGMALQVGVKIAIIRSGKVLLLKRARGKYTEIKTDRWDIVGGRIEPGKPLIENLKREIFEETKMQLVGEPKLLEAQDILKSVDKHVVRLTYIGEATGEPVLDEDHEEYKWCSFKELLALGEDLDVFFRELISKGIIHLE